MRKLLPVNLSTIHHLTFYTIVIALVTLFTQSGCSKKEPEKDSPEITVSIKNKQSIFAPTDTFTFTIEYKDAQEVSIQLRNTCGENTSSTIFPNEPSGVWEPSFSIADLDWRWLDVSYTAKAEGASTSFFQDSIFIASKPVVTEIWGILDNAQIEKIAPNGVFIKKESFDFEPFATFPSKPITQVSLNDLSAEVLSCSINEHALPSSSYKEIIQSNNKLLWLSNSDVIWVTSKNGTSIQEWQLNGFIPQKLIALKNYYYLLYTIANDNRLGLAVYDKQFNQIENAYPTTTLGVAKIDAEKIIIVEEFDETQSIARVFDTRLQSFSQQQTFFTVAFEDLIFHENNLIFKEADQLTNLALFTNGAQPSLLYSGDVKELKMEPLSGDLFWLDGSALVQKKGATQNTIYRFQVTPKRLLFQYEIR